MLANNFYIALYDAESKLISYPYYVDENDPAPEGSFPLGKGLTEYVLRDNHPVLIRPEMMERLRADEQVDLIGFMCVDWIGVALTSRNQSFGVIVARS